MRLLGKAHGASLYAHGHGLDDRPVVADRDAKSVSVEDTFDVDLHDRVRVRSRSTRLADRCVQRLRAAGRSGPDRRAEGAALRLLHAHPLRDAARAHRRPLGGAGDRRAAPGGRGHHRRGAAARAWASPGSPTSPRRTCSPRRPARRRAEAAATGGGAGGRGGRSAGRPPPPEPVRAERRWLPRAGRRHAEYGPGGCRAAASGGSPCASRSRRTRVPGRVRTFAVDDPELDRPTRCRWSR